MDKKIVKKVTEIEPPYAKIVITYTPTGQGYSLDIKCTNAHLIGTGRSERIASKLRKEIHRQRYHQTVEMVA